MTTLLPNNGKINRKNPVLVYPGTKNEFSEEILEKYRLRLTYVTGEGEILTINPKSGPNNASLIFIISEELDKEPVLVSVEQSSGLDEWIPITDPEFREVVDDKDAQYRDVNVLKSSFTKRPFAILFEKIVEGTNRISFPSYKTFMDNLFCHGFGDENTLALNVQVKNKIHRRFLPFNNSDRFRVLKAATEAFIMAQAEVLDFENFDEDQVIENAANKGIIFSGGNFRWPSDYLKTIGTEGQPVFILPFLYIIREKFLSWGVNTSWIEDWIEDSTQEGDYTNLESECRNFVRKRLQFPFFIELIWSYWQEEGMLVQTMNAISRRFQNIRGSKQQDPLAEFELSHLFPLNNLFWSYIQDQQHWLSTKRRAYEYDHHYGISLIGKAIPTLNSADSRTRFIESFHGILHLCSKFYHETANKLVDPDPFPILNALRELHFIIAEGMHNQYGDLPSTSRTEMMIQQWILSQEELREFLPGRAAIPYPEQWMGRIAAMNNLQGWTSTSPIEFNNLAKYGEQILLTIRFGDWQSAEPEDARLFVTHFRSQIQGYIHSYKAATGVDLTATVVGTKVDAHPPSFHLANRLKSRRNGNGKLPTPSMNGTSRKRPVDKEWN